MIEKAIRELLKEKRIITNERQVEKSIELAFDVAKAIDYYDESLHELFLELNEKQLFTMERFITRIKNFAEMT